MVDPASEDLWYKYLDVRWCTNYFALRERTARTAYQLSHSILALWVVVAILPYYVASMTLAGKLILGAASALVLFVMFRDFHARYTSWQKTKESYQRLGVRLKASFVDAVTFKKADPDLAGLLSIEGYLHFNHLHEHRHKMKVWGNAHAIVMDEVHEHWGIQPHTASVARPLRARRSERTPSGFPEWPTFKFDRSVQTKREKYDWVRDKTRYFDWAAGGDGGVPWRSVPLLTRTRIILRETRDTLSRKLLHTGQYEMAIYRAAQSLDEEITLHGSVVHQIMHEELPDEYKGK